MNLIGISRFFRQARYGGKTLGEQHEGGPIVSLGHLFCAYPIVTEPACRQGIDKGQRMRRAAFPAGVANSFSHRAFDTEDRLDNSQHTRCCKLWEARQSVKTGSFRKKARPPR